MVILFVVIMLLTSGMLLLLGYFIKYKKKYGLISGYSSYSKTEQEELIKNGYPQAIGQLIINSGIIMIGIILLSLFHVPYGIEIGFLVFLIYLMGGSLYYTKLDVESKRKQNRLIIIGITVFTLFIISITMIPMLQQRNELVIDENYVKITGAYGVRWPVSEIVDVQLLEELPRVEMRTGGFSAWNRSVGNFRLAELGRGRLFVYNNISPYIFVENDEGGFFIINSKDEEETMGWYQELKDMLE